MPVDYNEALTIIGTESDEKEKRERLTKILALPQEDPEQKQKQNDILTALLHPSVKDAVFNEKEKEKQVRVLQEVINNPQKSFRRMNAEANLRTEPAHILITKIEKDIKNIWDKVPDEQKPKRVKEMLDKIQTYNLMSISEKTNNSKQLLDQILTLGREAASATSSTPTKAFFDVIKRRNKVTIDFYAKFREGGEYDFYDKKEKSFDLRKRQITP